MSGFQPVLSHGEVRPYSGKPQHPRAGFHDRLDRYFDRKFARVSTIRRMIAIICPAVMRLPGSIMQICAYSSLRSFLDRSVALAGYLHRGKAALQFAQHVLQFAELARAIALGDLGIDRFRIRRDGFDQL